MAITRRKFLAPLPGMHILFMCMLTLALLLRAAIPTGFMPNAEAFKQGKIEITFCTAGGGVTTTVVDIDRHAPASPSPDHSSAACAFSASSPVALDLPLLAVQPVALHAATHPRPTHDRAGLPPLPALGPPLGARAPPYLG